ncbi:Tyrosine kinase receptor Cad96Ca [Stylophora pistillata]|uniref:receptor protein-tyrosine kinase n=1 Tax=Stylophora pistillata TaxID=50429 RepID=A0A2B4R6L7_STYPI|nr:Tyrosine kinase receptor Cad96Ca [Stylophora pistillata]
MGWSSWSGGCKECKSLQYRERVGPPTINPLLKNQSAVAYNSSLHFNCSLSGIPTPEVLWTRNGVNLSNNNALTIVRARLNDSGQYTCSAKNSEGSNNTTFWIEVAGVSPQIIVPPIDQSITEGYPVNFSCKATGVPTPTLVWVFNNGGLQPVISKADQEGASFLELPRVTKGMEGTYKCTAKNKENTTSSSATLLVYGKASAQVVSETYSKLTTGEVLALTCTVNEETVNITWKKDGEPLTERAVIEIRLDEKISRLVIIKVVEGDRGEYSCEASNQLGTVARSSVTLDVGGPPTINPLLKNQSAVAYNSLLHFNCFVSGIPTPEHAGWHTCEEEYKFGVFATQKIAVAISNIRSHVDQFQILFNNSIIGRSLLVDSTSVGVDYEEQDEVEMGQLNANTDGWEIAVDRLNFREPIGRGAFGSVWRALLGRSRGRPGNRTVAAKCYLLLQEVPTRSSEEHDEVELGQLNTNTDGWEIAVDRLNLREAIGRGAFGSVWRALLGRSRGRPGNRTVAAKCCLPISGEQGRQALLREIDLLKLFGRMGHENVVKFIGCVTVGAQPILIMEYLWRGDLLGYLRKSRGVFDHYHRGVGRVDHLTTYDMVLFAKQIAHGMTFLASRGIIHRDLAARNILLDEHRVCKLTDFGLSYQDFKYGPGNAKKTYVDIVNMDKYDHDKYKFIDDRGAAANREDAAPDEQGAAAAKPDREVGEHGATAYPFVAATEDGARAFPLAIKVEEGGAAHSFKNDEKGTDASEYLFECDTLLYLSESEGEDIDGSDCPLAIEEEDIDPLPSNLAMDDNGLGPLAGPIVTDEENPDCSTCFLVIEKENSSNLAFSSLTGEEGLEATACPPVIETEDPNSLAHPHATEVNRPDASQSHPVIGEEDVDSLEYPSLIEAEGHIDSAFSPEVEEGTTSKPETNADDQGAAVVQSVKETGEEELKTFQLKNTKYEQDYCGKHMEDQCDAVELYDEEVGVQEYNDYQLTAVDTDETGNEEDEETSEGTPLVQD